MSTPLVGHLAFAAGAGAATFLSPCALPLLPGYVGYYTSRSDGSGVSPAGLAARGLAAGAGALVALATLAALAVAVGRPLTSRLPALELLVGFALIALGGLVVAPYDPGWRLALPERRRSLGGFAAFGAAYGGAAAGCVLPVFLAVVVQALALPPFAAASVVGVYAGSVALPLLVVTLAVGLGVDVATSRLVGHGALLRRAAGVVLLAAGAGQLLVAVAPTIVPTPL